MYIRIDISIIILKHNSYRLGYNNIQAKSGTIFLAIVLYTVELSNANTETKTCVLHAAKNPQALDEALMHYAQDLLNKVIASD